MRMTIQCKDIEHLAGLSRISVSDAEIEGLRHDLEEILAYVSEIKNVATGEIMSTVGEVRNVLRDDENPHEVGKYREDLLTALPSREGNRALVKKIL